MKRHHEGSSSSNAGKRQQNSYQSNVQSTKWAQQLAPDSLDAAKGRDYTVTVGIPGSILRQAQTKELRTALIGQVARACSLYEVDEIVIFIDSTYEAQLEPERQLSVLFTRILQYIECPPYLRKDLFPMHPDLKFCGLLPPLEIPHHMRRDDIAQYREGVTIDKFSESSDNSIVNVGLMNEVQIDHALKPGTRVTVRIEQPGKPKKLMSGTACAPSEPSEKYGLYWGYQTRLCSQMSEVFSGCPHEGGYDLMIGMSREDGDASLEDAAFKLPPFKHALLLFGGEGGLKSGVDADESLHVHGRDTRSLFSHYLNVCSGNGSRRIRPEEEVMVALTRMHPLFAASAAASKQENL